MCEPWLKCAARAGNIASPYRLSYPSASMKNATKHAPLERSAAAFDPVIKDLWATNATERNTVPRGPRAGPTCVASGGLWDPYSDRRPACGPPRGERRADWYGRLSALAKEHKLWRFATLTLDPSRIPKSERSDRSIHKCWRKLRVDVPRR